MKNLNVANKDGYRFGQQAYLIGNGLGLLCVACADNEQDAFDEAADAGFMGSEMMSEADHQEYEANGWNDSYIYAGNAGEPFWSEYLWIKPASEEVINAVHELAEEE